MSTDHPPLHIVRAVAEEALAEYAANPAKYSDARWLGRFRDALQLMLDSTERAGRVAAADARLDREQMPDATEPEGDAS